MTLIEGCDVFVHVLDLPGVNEAVAPNDDGTYTIFIDAKLAPDAQHERYEHALKHIQDNDFEKADVQCIEAAAHKPTEKAPEPAPSPAPAPVPAFDFEKRIRACRRRKKAIEKKLKKYEEDMAFLARVCPEHFGSIFEITELPGEF